MGASSAEYLVYAANQARGIYGFRFDTGNARIRSLGLMAPVSNTAFVVAHPDHRYLYVASGEGGGSVSAYLIEPRNGRLSLVNKSSSGGAGPVGLALDREGRWLAVANGAGDNIAILPLRKDGGTAGVQAPVAQSKPASVMFSPDNRFLLAAGGDGRIHVYRFDAATGALARAGEPFKGRGPVVFHPNGRIAYAIDAEAPVVSAFHYAPDTGELTHMQDVPVTAGAPLLDLAVRPNGTALYASVSNDNIALFAIDLSTFALSPPEITPLVGSMPRAFAIEPGGGYLLVANENSNNVSTYSLHPHTGQLRPAGKPPSIENPVSIVIVAK